MARFGASLRTLIAVSALTVVVCAGITGAQAPPPQVSERFRDRLSAVDSLAEASRLVRDRAVRRIPVLRDGTPVGVVSIGDLALESDATSVRSGMSSAPPNS